MIVRIDTLEEAPPIKTAGAEPGKQITETPEVSDGGELGAGHDPASSRPIDAVALAEALLGTVGQKMDELLGLQTAQGKQIADLVAREDVLHRVHDRLPRCRVVIESNTRKRLPVRLSFILNWQCFLRKSTTVTQGTECFLIEGPMIRQLIKELFKSA